MHHIYTCLKEIGRLNIDCDEAPSFPVELLEEILTVAWLSNMSPDERHAFTISNLLVSKIWMETFRRVSNRHVFISSSEFLEAWRRNLQSHPPYSRYSIRQDADPINSCHTFTRQTTLVRRVKGEGSLYRQLLSTFHALPYLPNLRELTFECFILVRPSSWGVSLPVVHLAVEYTFHLDTHTWISDALLLSHSSGHKHVPWALPELELISTANNDPETIGAVLERFSHLEVSPDRNLKVGMKILSSSGHIPENCAIVHGPVSTFRTMSVSHRESRFECGTELAPRIVRGVGVALVLDVGGTRDRGNLIDPSNTIRCGHVFVQRQRFFNFGHGCVLR